MTTHSWDPKYEALLQADLTASFANPNVQALSNAQKQRLLGVNTAVEDVSCITLIYLDGFAEVAAGGSLKSAVGATVAAWVKRVDPKKSGTRLAGIVASNICSLLEEFIWEEGDDRMSKNPNIISSLTPKRSLDKDPIVAKDQLLKATAPTVRADGAKWLNAVEDVFSLTLPAHVTGSVIPMIAFRNDFVHDPSSALQQTKTGEELTCWMLAAHLTAYALALG